MPDRSRRQKKTKAAPALSPLKQITAIEVRGERFDITPRQGYEATVIQLAEYRAWLAALKDVRARARIESSVGRLARGLMGDWKEVGGVYETRIDYASGYRVYFAKHGNSVFVIALGGDKSSQSTDIDAAIAIWKEVKNGIKEIRG